MRQPHRQRGVVQQIRDHQPNRGGNGNHFRRRLIRRDLDSRNRHAANIGVRSYFVQASGHIHHRRLLRIGPRQSAEGCGQCRDIAGFPVHPRRKLGGRGYTLQLGDSGVDAPSRRLQSLRYQLRDHRLAQALGFGGVGLRRVGSRP